MDIITILDALKKYGLFAVMAVVFFAGVLGVACLLYSKLFHGTKSLCGKQWIAAILLFGWFMVVLGLTTLSRGANYTGRINFSLFSGYVNAWNEWSLKEYQLILFNMLMFSPLGFLLPFLTKKGEKLSVACMVSFLVTLSVEVLQLVTGRGIFELDDILHNFVGSLFGYFMAAFLLDVMKRKKLHRRPLMRMLAIPLFYAVLTVTAVIAYNLQSYGNLPFLPAEKQNMSAVTVVNQAQLSDETGPVPVFHNVFANDEARINDIRQSLSEFLHVSFDKPVRTEGTNKVFQSSAEDAQLTAFLRSGNWSYTNWKQAARLSQKQVSAYREAVESWLSENGLLPKTAVFSLQDETILRWDAEMPSMEKQTADFAAGIIMVTVDAAGKIADFYCDISQYQYAGTLECIAASQAYARILEGNFEKYEPFTDGDILVVTGCVPDYVPDTKGFFRPVYCFEGYINDRDNGWTGVVSAE